MYASSKISLQLNSLLVSEQPINIIAMTGIKKNLKIFTIFNYLIYKDFIIVIYNISDLKKCQRLKVLYLRVNKVFQAQS